MPDIGVVIPAYNSALYISQAVKSIQDQTHVHWRMVIVDDGSSDETGQIVQTISDTDDRIKYIRQENQGVSAARNNGVEELDTPWIYFLDADDIAEPWALEELLLTATEGGRHHAAHGLATQFGDQEKTDYIDYLRDRRALCGSEYRRLGPNEPTTFASLIRQNGITIGSILIHKESFMRIGGFDANIKHCEDWNFFLRLSLSDDINFLDRSVLRYRRHESNASNNLDAMRLAERSLLKSMLQSPLLSPSQKAVLHQRQRLDFIHRRDRIRKEFKLIFGSRRNLGIFRNKADVMLAVMRQSAGLFRFWTQFPKSAIPRTWSKS
ncbi:MAG TPA: glycosyltransferase family 2 protein [Fimbriimonadaceae bacterium]|nr:glycosyltransferase family 2 protein [Fimbriimonadaceae bacterium]